MTIAEDALLENSVPEDVGRPKKNFLKRVANRARAKLRPEEPKELGVSFIDKDDFLVAYIQMESQQHFVFATENQLSLQHDTKRWYIDGTFKVVGEPFRSNGQLFSIHAFIEKAGQLKQMPLAFCLMSRLRQCSRVNKGEDRDSICRRLCRRLSAWQAVRDVFPGVEVKGCAFHSSQAVWRHVQSVGLAEAYQRRIGVHNFVRMLLALQFLPVAHISPSSGCTKSKGNISFDRATR
ncbi:uncharacterized protein LOC128246231 [Mya arenaria]|uniref:uncharacterized protein LOC128246231 n=1 Tax=Mya arenaria TaxID=6604 RepID=UPI0022E6CCBB|nr:uncharacterized protein LOC128246231 [Mya arenaria]